VDRRSVHIHEGATRQLLITLTEQLPADLVVMGAVSRSALQRLFVGSTAEQVLDMLACDVLIVKPRID
jgi:universal stress protein E